MRHPDLEDLHAKLGIAPGYGNEPHLPRYEEAQELVEVEANSSGQIQRLTPETARKWQGMKLAAMADGIDLQIISGFRSIDRQQQIIAGKLAKGLAIEEILKINAAPGFSQHHTGMALDLGCAEVPPLSEEFEKTATFRWLLKNAANHGFYLPYPRGNDCGFCYEPWHWASLRLKHR